MKILKSHLEEKLGRKKSVDKLSNQLTMLGLEVDSIAKLKSDFCIDIDLTPNRGDCFSALGVAREIAAADQTSLKKENYSVKIKSDGTLAGSIVTMDQTFKNLISMNFSLEEAVALTSYNASKYMNLDNVGIIQKNFLSNFLILDKEFNLKEVYLRGKKINV